MRERPILFSAPMVRSILEGRKTQTRRIVRPQPYFVPVREHWQWDGARGHASWSGDRPQAAALLGLREHCPYGRPGDRLWVKEAWRTGAKLDDWSPSEIAKQSDEAGYGPPCPGSPACPIRYEADQTVVTWGPNDEKHFGAWGRYRRAMVMPRWASRITLEVTGVRVERLQDISEEDALSEGIRPVLLPMAGARGTTLYAAEWPSPIYSDTSRYAFASLWRSINGAESWNANPWVWVVEFRRVQPC